MEDRDDVHGADRVVQRSLQRAKVLRVSSHRGEARPVLELELERDAGRVSAHQSSTRRRLRLLLRQLGPIVCHRAFPSSRPIISQRSNLQVSNLHCSRIYRLEVFLFLIRIAFIKRFTYPF